MINNVGPKPETCTIERVIIRVKEHLSSTLANLSLSVKKDTTHSIILSGRFNSLSLLIRITWSTKSTASAKSISKHHTYV